jgi:hypothetical protein
MSGRGELLADLLDAVEDSPEDVGCIICGCVPERPCEEDCPAHRGRVFIEEILKR